MTIPQADLLSISLLLVSVKDTPVTSLNQGRVRSLLECAHACLLRGEWRVAHEAIAKAKTHETDGTLSRRFLVAFRELRAKHEPRPAPIVAPCSRVEPALSPRPAASFGCRYLTPEEQAHGLALRAGGWSFIRLAEVLEANPGTLHGAVHGKTRLQEDIIAALLRLEVNS